MSYKSTKLISCIDKVGNESQELIYLKKQNQKLQILKFNNKLNFK